MSYAGAGAPGVPGAPGNIGPQGIPGPQGPIGPAPVARGAYAAGTAYAVNDLAVSNGTTYISLQNANVGHDPATSPAWWAVFAAQGNVGPQGIQGPQGNAGPQGIQGNAGPQGIQGPQGAAGASLSVLGGTSGVAPNSAQTVAANNWADISVQVPALNFVAPASGRIRVSISGTFDLPLITNSIAFGFRLSGATVVAASLGRALNLRTRTTANGGIATCNGVSTIVEVEGLTPGGNYTLNPTYLDSTTGQVTGTALTGITQVLQLGYTVEG